MPVEVHRNADCVDSARNGSRPSGQWD